MTLSFVYLYYYQYYNVTWRPNQDLDAIMLGMKKEAVRISNCLQFIYRRQTKYNYHFADGKQKE